MSSYDGKLVSMANQIARFYMPQKQIEPVGAIATHIRKFWDPRMRAAIIAHETGAVDSMTREEKLEAIWNATHPDFRGVAGATNPHAWPPEHHGKRTILFNAGGQGSVLKLLEDLSNDEIDELLSAARSRRSPLRGGDDADRS